MTAMDLAPLLGQLMALVHHRSAGETLAVMNEAGLTMPQVVALYVLIEHEQMTVTALAETLHLSAPATSHLLDRLVKAQLVDRTEDPDDRRQKRIAITAAGAILVRRMHEARAQECAMAFGRLSQRVRKDFAGALSAVVAELAGLPDVAGPGRSARPPCDLATRLSRLYRGKT